MALDNFRRITINVDTANDYIAPIMLSSGDANGRTLLVKLTDNGRSLTSADGIVARLTYDDKSGNSGFKTMDFVDGLETAAWECTAPSSILNGSYALLCIQFWQGADVVCTRVFRANVERSLICLDPGTESGDAVKELYDAIANLNKTITDANNTLSTAVSSANTEVNAAIGRADASTEKATSAASAASENAGKAESAATAATKAAEQANGAADRAAAATSKAETAAASANTTTESAKASEQARVKAEKARSDADAQRETRQLKNDADQAQNNAAAKGLTYSVCGASEYAIDPVDGKHNIPTVGGKTGVMYLTPKVSGATEEDAYDQWMYIDSKWELMGESGAHIDPTTTDDIDRIMLDSQVTADRYLNATGLTYFWAKAKEKFSAIFAQKSHSHSASDITSVLPVLHGGTGSTDAESARAALGAASSADLATLRDSVSRAVLFNNKNIDFKDIVTLSQDPAKFARVKFTCITDDNDQFTVDYVPGLGTTRFIASCARINLSNHQVFLKTRTFDVVGRTVNTASDTVSGKRHWHSGQVSIPGGSLTPNDVIKIVRAVGYMS